MIWWVGSHDANSRRVFREVLWIKWPLNGGLMSHVGISGNHIPGWRTWKAKNLRQTPFLTLGSSMGLALAHGMFLNTMASNDLKNVCFFLLSCMIGCIFFFQVCLVTRTWLTHLRCMRNTWRNIGAQIQLTASQVLNGEPQKCFPAYTLTTDTWVTQVEARKVTHWPIDLGALLNVYCFKPQSGDGLFCSTIWEIDNGDRHSRFFAHGLAHLFSFLSQQPNAF